MHKILCRVTYDKAHLFSFDSSAHLHSYQYIKQFPTYWATYNSRLSILQSFSIYTVSLKKHPRRLVRANLGKLLPILIILSPLHSEMNCRRNWSKIRHIALNILPHYLVKFECSNVQLFVDISQHNRHTVLKWWTSRRFCLIDLFELNCLFWEPIWYHVSTINHGTALQQRVIDASIDEVACTMQILACRWQIFW